MAREWRAIKWRPVVSYSRNHLKGILGMVGKWSMYVLKSLRIGDGETNVGGVTERVHKYNGGARTKGAWERQRRLENQVNESKRKRMKRSKLQWKNKPGERKLEKTIWDLTNFFIKVPRKTFFRETMKKLMERIKKGFPGKEWF